ncbi:MAG: methyltransferase [Pseudomonadota bacterium]
MSQRPASPNPTAQPQRKPEPQSQPSAGTQPSSPQTAPELFAKAQQLDKTGQQDAALAHYRFCIALDPTHGQALFRAANLLVISNQVSASLPYYHVLTTLKPDYNPARINYAIALKRLGRLDQALSQLETVVDQDAQSLHAWQQLADVYRTLGQPMKSQEAYRQWAALDPKDPKPRFMIEAVGHSLAPDGEAPGRAPDEYVVAYFDSYAHSFDDHAASIMRYQVPGLFKRLVHHFGYPGLSDVAALDLGCGTGLCGEFLAPFCARLDGIDLSPAMIAKAQAKGYYSRLVDDDLLPGMKGLPNHDYDLVLAGDVFCYMGDLAPVFEAAHGRLAPDGRFMFTVEAMTYLEVDQGASDYMLRDSGRYAHHRDYLHQVAEAAGFTVELSGYETLRLEFGKPVAGWLLVLKPE